MMKKRLLITGASGFVAGSAIRQASDAYEVHAVSRGAAPDGVGEVHWHVADILDSGVFQRLVDDIRPNAIIHAAALADIDFCEANPAQARAVNVDATSAIARVCASGNVRLVFLSTDTVFGGGKGMYTEEDASRPVNVYALTKVDAERRVREASTDYVIVRTAIVVGLPVIGSGNSFVSRMVKSLVEGKTVSVPQEEIRSPVDVATLGAALIELAESDYRGILHVAGNDILSRLDMAYRIAARLGFASDKIVATAPSTIPGRAARPRDVSLDNHKARSVLKTGMCGLDEGLERMLLLQQGRSRA